MDNTNYDEKWYSDENDSSDDSDSFEEEEKEQEEYEFSCKNIDPKLAALMNIVIEEHAKLEMDNSWKPPSSSGLDNSEPIVKKTESKEPKEIAFYEQLKDDITYFRKLTDKQLDYMKHSLTNDQKIEVIELYNVCQEYCRKK